jgi:hypothetical protein
MCNGTLANESLGSFRSDSRVSSLNPDSISNVFSPYRRILPDHSYETPDRRVIAPVPNKGPDLQRAFVSEIFSKARSLVRESGTLVAVGYSFNNHDSASYAPILQALDASRERKLIVVCTHPVNST